MRLAHGLILLSAFLFLVWRLSNPPAFAWHPEVELPPLDASGPGPDSISRICLGCHTDSPEGTAPAHAEMRILVFRFSGSHAIGFDYAQAVADNPKMNPRPELPLPGGKVSCLSCHDLEAPRRYLLVDDYGGGNSALCRRCHSGY